MFEERHRRNKMKLENGAIYYLDLGRMSFQQPLYRPLLPPLEGDGVISTPTFFTFRFSFYFCRCCVEFKLLSLKLSGDSIVFQLS